MNFDPLRITMTNFMNHSYSDIDLSNIKSCLIVGKDRNNSRKSNGVGKSTIFHAIDYALFDVYPTKTLDKIVRDEEDKCEVAYTFSVDEVNYRITRKRSNKSNKSEVLLEQWNGVSFEKTDHRTKTDTEKVIKDLVRINYETYKNAILFAQNSFSDLAEGTDAQKRQALKEPLDLSHYSKYEKLAKKKYSDLEKKYDANKVLVGTLGDPDSDVKQLTQSLSMLSDGIKHTEASLTDVKNNISAFKSSVSELEKLLTSDAAKVSEQLVQLYNSKVSLANDISRIKTSSKNNLEEYNSYNKSISELENSVKIFETELASLKEKQFQSEEEINNQIQEINDKEQKGRKYIASLEHDLEKYSKPLPKGSQCEVCFNELNDEYRDKISSGHTHKCEEIKDNLNKSNAKLQKLTKKKVELYQELKDISKHQLTINSTVNNIASSLRTLETSRSLQAKYKKMYEDEENKSKLKEEELILILEKESSLKSQAENFNIKEINDKIININSQIRGEELKESSLMKDISTKYSLFGAADNKKNSRIEDGKKLKELLALDAELTRELKVHGKVVKAFSSSGIPTLIIHTILDDLQVEANNILQSLRPELSLQFAVEKDDKEILDIHYKLNGKERDYKQLSGGQKTYISFALKLGLSLIIQKRMGINFKLLELDEVDQPLDEDGKDAFIEVVRSFQDKFKILIVTHDNKLKDKFSHAILVENDESGATAKLVTEW